MNLYSINTIKQNLAFSPLVYSVKKSDCSEALVLPYSDTDNAEHTETLAGNNSMLTNWMELLDYDTSEKEPLDKTFSLLLSTLNFLGISKEAGEELPPDSVNCFLKGFNANTFSDTASSVLDILKECFDPHPILTYLYPHYYALLHALFLYSNKNISYEDVYAAFSTRLPFLYRELLHMESSYKEARDYIQPVLIEPYTDSASIHSTASASLYHSYCKAIKQPDFYMETSDFPFEKDHLKNNFGKSTPEWTSYFEKFLPDISDTDVQKYPITTFAQFLHIGLSIMLSGGTVIRKCRLCGGYFQAKHSSDQMYCSRIYKNTAATCSEVGVRKTYKEKLFQHPIHQEFTKSYNKLYGRIRRGKVPADTPLMDELKRLHDEYTEKYENTHTKDREAVWKEYIQKNKELLG